MTIQHSDEAAGEHQPETEQSIREDIERTRAELGDTVERLAAKADVKARAKHAASGVAGTGRTAARHAKKYRVQLAVAAALMAAAALVRKIVANRSRR
jgi:hypothetical protein